MAHMYAEPSPSHAHCSVTGCEDAITSALHIILGDRQALDVAGVFVDGKLNRFAVSMLSYGFYGDVMKVSLRRFRRSPQATPAGPNHPRVCCSTRRTSGGWAPCGTTLPAHGSTSARPTTQQSMGAGHGHAAAGWALFDSTLARVTQGWRALTVCRVMYKPSDEGRENVLCEVGCTQCPPDPPATTHLDIAAEERLVNMATGKGLGTGHVISTRSSEHAAESCNLLPLASLVGRKICQRNDDDYISISGSRVRGRP
jgi:hypothetical protein